MPSQSPKAASDAKISNQEYTSAVELLHQIIPQDELQAYSLHHSPATVYTTLATLWMLTLQRLGGGRVKSWALEAIVRETLTHHRDIFPDNKRVREGTLSKNTSAYSESRQRLPIEVVEKFTDSVAQTIIDRCPETVDERQAFIIDGTTFALPPTSSLREVGCARVNDFTKLCNAISRGRRISISPSKKPPATNQFGETVWPIMMLTVAHELRSGAALRPEFGAMYGGKNTSEAKQAIAISNRIPAESIVLADSGYGIFSVTYGMVQAGHDVLFRMTKSRFKSLSRRAQLMEKGEHHSRYRLVWQPSPKDRKTNPHLPEDASVLVELHAIELDSGEWLYLVASMKLTRDDAADLYNRRYDVEHDIRDIKVTLNLENVRAQSDEMVRKEMLCSMVAYNLVVQLRHEAAKLAKLPPRRLSFSGCWYSMQSCLLHQSACDAATWQDRYAQAVQMASTDKLPNRPGRSFPRRAHPKRPKSTKFMKQQSKTTNKSPPKKTK